MITTFSHLNLSAFDGEGISGGEDRERDTVFTFPSVVDCWHVSKDMGNIQLWNVWIPKWRTSYPLSAVDSNLYVITVVVSNVVDSFEIRIKNFVHRGICILCCAVSYNTVYCLFDCVEIRIL